MKRILHIVQQFQPGGGIDRVVMNFFSHIDHKEFRFDVLTHRLDDRSYADRIEECGGSVIEFPPLSLRNMASNARRFDEMLSGSHYDAVHCHMVNAAFIYLRIAKRHGVPVRISHSHQDHYADVWSHAARNVPLVALGKRYANVNVACSKAAGDFLFGKRPYVILNNGIDIDAFRFSPDKRKAFRNDHDIRDGQVLFGFVGRLTPQKNPLFMLQVFARCVEHPEFSDARLCIAGDGDMRQDMRVEIEKLGIADRVIWLGNIDGVAALDSGIDILLMPSVYEGLGLSLVEAQTAGACCFASDTIPQEAFASEFAHPLDIHDKADAWAEAIVREFDGKERRSEGASQVAACGFDVNDNVRLLERIYSQDYPIHR